jgi:hypothetical protein
MTRPETRAIHVLLTDRDRRHATTDTDNRRYVPV